MVTSLAMLMTMIMKTMILVMSTITLVMATLFCQTPTPPGFPADATKQAALYPVVPEK